jgi:hypothetical protein
MLIDTIHFGDLDVERIILKWYKTEIVRIGFRGTQLVNTVINHGIPHKERKIF